ncbi:MAG TPA: ABC transporter substrate-binding protein [Firmicutes bacterium]|nr:ABC transporter substrate-binding protein [Bacillota bacterium]
MKKLLTALMALFALTTVVACSNEGTEKENEKGEEKSELTVSISEPVTLEFWHAMGGANEEAVNYLVEDFNNTVGKDLGITIEPIYQGSYNDLKSKVTAAIKSGTAPAISQAYPDWVAEYLQADVVVALDEYINHSEVGIKDFDGISEAYRAENSQYTTDGTFYSLPFNKSTEVLYYNKDFFEANDLTAPTTWDEMEEVSAKIFELTGKPAFGIDSAQNMFITLVQQFGGEYTTSQGEIKFGEGDAAVQALELIKRNTDAGYWRLPGEDKYMSGPFTNELVYMYIGSTSGAAFVNNDNFQWSSAPIPQQSESTKAVIQQGTNVVIMNQDKTEEEVYAAYEFGKYLGSEEANLYWATHTGYLPIRQTVIDMPEYQAYVEESGDSTKVSGPAQSEYYFYDPAFFSGSISSYNVRTEAGNAVEQVVLNGMEPAAAVEAALNALK